MGRTKGMPSDLVQKLQTARSIREAPRYVKTKSNETLTITDHPILSPTVKTGKESLLV